MPALTVHGHVTYYEWRGPGHRAGMPALVFLHDGLGATGAWRTVPDQIATRLKLPALLYDRRGYGRSAPRQAFPFGFMEQEVEPLQELLDALAIPQVHLVGHSDGGSIALLFAAAHPGHVLTVTTEAAHVFVEPETQHGIRALAALQQAGKTPAWLRRLHGERGEEVLRAWARGWLTEEHERWNIETAVSGVRCPLLVIQGDQDEFGTLAQVEAILRRAPHGERWVVPGSGHTPHSAVEADFVARVADFIARNGRRPPSADCAGSAGPPNRR
jgi:pimeloyl-ACP methyl ester carboxylesterase